MTWVLILRALIQTTGNELVARWDADAGSRGGLGAWMTLAAFHTCMQTTAAMADGTRGSSPATDWFERCLKGLAATCRRKN
jgi:hypothetical protein